MKIFIGPYKNWFGPHQLAEKICFWVKPVKDEHGFESKPEWVYNFGLFLAHGFGYKEKKSKKFLFVVGDEPKTWLYKLLIWIDSKRKRKIKIQIDKFDAWNADHTLSLIILPLLEKVQSDKHGAPYVDDSDVPVGLRTTAAKPKENEWDVDEHHFKRWDYVINEMIFAFKLQLKDDWEQDFYSGVDETLLVEDSESGLIRLKNGPNHTKKFDEERYNRVVTRQKNGFRLFGKYFQSLWT